MFEPFDIRTLPYDEAPRRDAPAERPAPAPPARTSAAKTRRRRRRAPVAFALVAGLALVIGAVLVLTRGDAKKHPSASAKTWPT